jgi:hypothetical protein
MTAGVNDNGALDSEKVVQFFSVLPASGGV